MLKNSKHLILIVALFVIAIILLLSNVFGVVSKKIFVYKVIDGDTFEDDMGNKYRLVGVNTPEKGEFCYDEAKNFLTSLVLGKEIDAVNYGKEKYGRILVEIYVGDRNINHELLANGLANVYYSKETGINWKKYFEAEEKGRMSKGCMWKASPFKECLVGKRIGDSGFIIENVCSINITREVIIRDSSALHRFKRNISVAPKSSIEISELCGEEEYNKIFLCEHVFNKEGDELIVYDDKGVLVFTSYGTYSQYD